jgi:hypothetical protein
MSFAESGKVEGNLDELRKWPSSERFRLARLILETIETQPVSQMAAQRPAEDAQDGLTAAER